MSLRAEKMSLRKRKAAEIPADTPVLHLNVLMDAFHYCWLSALETEALTSANIAYAPRQLLQSVLMTAEATHASADRLGQIAFEAWQSSNDDLSEAVPPTQSVN
jgi:hypothetical protein